MKDFDVNAVGTLNLLEAARRGCPGSPFIHMSTNKVCGDALNRLDLVEQETRWGYSGTKYANGIPRRIQRRLSSARRVAKRNGLGSRLMNLQLYGRGLMRSLPEGNQSL